jgi:hypothetical protein
MTDCIIQADFSSFRPVNGRRILQLVFEIPIENGEEALRMLGMPRPGENRWCAIALLDLKPKQAEGQVSEANGSPKKWSEMKRSQQAWLLCEDPAFWSYFDVKTEDTIIDTARTAATKLRAHFHLRTRSELDLPENHARWDEFVALWNLHRQKHAGRPLG